MDPSAALLAGLAAGLAIAMQVGAVSLLLVEASVVSGPRAGVAAGMGVAAADLGFAAIAAAAGGAAGAALSSHESEIRVIAAIVIAAIAVHGLIALAREQGDAAGRALHRMRPPPPRPRTAPSTHFARFLAITAANPADDRLLRRRRRRPLPRRARRGGRLRRGRGLASAAWHLLLTPRRRSRRALDDARACGGDSPSRAGWRCSPSPPTSRSGSRRR